MNGIISDQLTGSDRKWEWREKQKLPINAPMKKKIPKFLDFISGQFPVDFRSKFN